MGEAEPLLPHRRMPEEEARNVSSASKSGVRWVCSAIFAAFSLLYIAVSLFLTSSLNASRPNEAMK
jgi:hypothetical protein